MRLTPLQHSTLVTDVRHHFGSLSGLCLYGSRLNDAVLSADFDFMPQADCADAHELYGAKLALLADLHATPESEGERIDLLLHSPSSTLNCRQ